MTESDPPVADRDGPDGNAQDGNAQDGGGTQNGGGAQAPWLITLVRALIEDVQTLIAAETGYWRNAATFAAAQARTIAILLGLALFFVFFTLMAVVVGLLLALAPLIGPWGALALVSLSLAAAAGLCARSAIARLRRAVRLLTGGEA